VAAVLAVLVFWWLVSAWLLRSLRACRLAGEGWPGSLFPRSAL
jgi:hypothetical protein